MNQKRYHLFMPNTMRYEAHDYEDSFVKLIDAYEVFIDEEPSSDGFIMQNTKDGGLVRTHEFCAEHYWDNGEHAYRYSISHLIEKEEMQL